MSLIKKDFYHSYIDGNDLVGRINSILSPDKKIQYAIHTIFLDDTGTMAECVNVDLDLSLDLKEIPNMTGASIKDEESFIRDLLAVCIANRINSGKLNIRFLHSVPISMDGSVMKFWVRFV